MFGGRGIQAPEIILILVVILLLFGARKLPETAKGMGQALKIFKKEVKEEDAPKTPEITANEAPSTPTVSSEQVQQPAPQEHERS